MSCLALFCGEVYAEEEKKRAVAEANLVLAANQKTRLLVFQSQSLRQLLVHDQNLPVLFCASPAEISPFLTTNSAIDLIRLYVPKVCDASFLRSWGSGAHSFVRSALVNSESSSVKVFVDAKDFQQLIPNGFAVVDEQQQQMTKLAVSKLDRNKLTAKAFQLLMKIDTEIASNLMQAADEQLNVLVIGNGGREHAIASKLAESPRCAHVFVAPGNGGTAKGNKKISNVNDISVNDHGKIVDFARSNAIGLCVVGPEAPLVAGLVDLLQKEANIPTFGPSAAAAQLEASKAFSKDFMKRHCIPTADYQKFKDQELAKQYLKDTFNDNPLQRVVVKASGIAAGKGVLLPTNLDEALEAVDEIMVKESFGSGAGDEVVIEDFLEGEEVSVLAFCDGGSKVQLMPSAQDHKRIFDADLGPNTGGMGAYSPAPCLTKELKAEVQKIMNKVVAAMAEEGMPYTGVLYGGFMLTKKGATVLEFNCRFGDPETQVLLPLLQSDLLEVFLACVEHRLNDEKIYWRTGSAATVVLASEGYPQKYPKNRTILGISSALALNNTQVFQAGTAMTSNGSIVTSGGRVLTVTGLGANLKEAIRTSYSGIQKITFEGAQYRSDIGLKGLLHETTKLPLLRVAVLGSTRGSSMQSIIDAIEIGDLKNVKIEVVISNKKKSGILERGEKHNIPCKFVSCLKEGNVKRTRDEFDEEVSAILEEHRVDLVLLIGYMRILSSSFCAKWENRVLNVHPSLLPDFAGGMDLAVHEAVLKAKKTKSGCTVHFVTEEVDNGPILLQLVCDVDPVSETANTLKAKVQHLERTAFVHVVRVFQLEKLMAPIAISKFNNNNKTITYADAGVSIDAGNLLVEKIKPLCKGTLRPGCDADLGGFGGLFDLESAGFSSDTVLVACTDGVGTKLKIAQIMNKHDTVGIDLVAMCVNDLIVQGAEPLFFLDYYACGKLEVEAAAQVVKGIANGCQQSKCGLIGGETAEMPSMYSGEEYDLAGFSLGAVVKSKLLPKKVEAGNVLLGLYSSGVHSNGFSLVRKIVETHKLSYFDPCIFEDNKQGAQSLGEVLLTPTRIYVQQLMPLIKKDLVNALAHITGGGLLENIPRILPKNLAVSVDCTSWDLLPVFKWLQKKGNLSQTEMTRTFNCGIGMVLLISQDVAQHVTKLLEQSGEKVIQMGAVVPISSNKEQVILTGDLK